MSVWGSDDWRLDVPDHYPGATPAAVLDERCVHCGAPAAGIGVRSGDPMCTTCRRHDRAEAEREARDQRNDDWQERLGVKL